MVNVSQHLGLLGMRVKDRVTGFEGVVSSVSFDLYGCIQAVVTPAAGEKGKLEDSRWFDVQRLEIVAKEPVMAKPEFDYSPADIAAGKKGPAEKPTSPRY